MSLSFEELRKVNVRRTEQIFHKVFDWSPTDWATAMAGECGEACNKIKKLRRGEQIPTSEIADELADLVIYADLLAERLGVDLGQAVVTKFNRVSEFKGSDVFLTGSADSDPAWLEEVISAIETAMDIRNPEFSLQKRVVCAFTGLLSTLAIGNTYRSGVSVEQEKTLSALRAVNALPKTWVSKAVASGKSTVAEDLMRFWGIKPESKEEKG